VEKRLGPSVRLAIPQVYNSQVQVERWHLESTGAQFTDSTRYGVNFYLYGREKTRKSAKLLHSTRHHEGKNTFRTALNQLQLLTFGGPKQDGLFSRE
jgi:hypothetical protein